MEHRHDSLVKINETKEGFINRKLLGFLNIDQEEYLRLINDNFDLMVNEIDNIYKLISKSLNNLPKEEHYKYKFFRYFALSILQLIQLKLYSSRSSVRGLFRIRRLFISNEFPISHLNKLYYYLKRVNKIELTNRKRLNIVFVIHFLPDEFDEKRIFIENLMLINSKYFHVVILDDVLDQSELNLKLNELQIDHLYFIGHGSETGFLLNKDSRITLDGLNKLNNLSLQKVKFVCFFCCLFGFTIDYKTSGSTFLLCSKSGMNYIDFKLYVYSFYQLFCYENSIPIVFNLSNYFVELFSTSYQYMELRKCTI